MTQLARQLQANHLKQIVESIKCYVSAPAIQALENENQLLGSAELRTVTILFISLPWFPFSDACENIVEGGMDPHRNVNQLYLDQLHQLFTDIEEIAVKKMEGTIRQLIIVSTFFFFSPCISPFSSLHDDICIYICICRTIKERC